MKTAAAIVIIIALVSVFHKEKKHEPPPVISRPSTSSTVKPGSGAYAIPDFSTLGYELPADQQAAANKIVAFAKERYKNRAASDEILYKVAAGIVKYSAYYQIDYALAAALIARESGFNPNATSPHGAKGLGQLIDSTASHMGISDPYDIDQNLRGSLGYFKKLLDMSSGLSSPTERALISYLVGPGAVSKDDSFLNNQKNQEYISTILGFREQILNR